MCPEGPKRIGNFGLYTVSLPLCDWGLPLMLALSPSDGPHHRSSVSIKRLWTEFFCLFSCWKVFLSLFSVRDPQHGRLGPIYLAMLKWQGLSLRQTQPTKSSCMPKQYISCFWVMFESLCNFCKWKFSRWQRMTGVWVCVPYWWRVVGLMRR